MKRLFPLKHVKNGFIVVVLMLRGGLVCCVISVCRGCLGNNTNDKKKEILEFKLVEVLGETNKFCHLNDMLSCYCGVSLAISARVGSTLKKGGFD